MRAYDEAGPLGSAPQRQLEIWGLPCEVMAPSVIPYRPAEQPSPLSASGGVHGVAPRASRRVTWPPFPTYKCRRKQRMCQSPTCRLVVAAAAERRGHIGSSPTPGEAAAPQGPAKLPHEVDSDVSPPPSGLPFRERGETMAGQLSDGEAARGCRAPGYCRLLLIWRSGGAAPLLCARIGVDRFDELE